MKNPFKKLYGFKPRTVPFYQTWDNTLVSLLKKNKSLHNVKPIRTYNMYNDNVALYSGRRNITYMYSIDAFDIPLDIDFRSYLRSYCQPGVRLNFISFLDPHTIDWSDRTNKNKINSWGAIDRAVSEENVNAYNYAENISKLDKTSNRRNSLVYLSDATQRRGRQVFKTQFIMLISGIRSIEFDTSVQKIEEGCKTLGLKYSRLTGNLTDYLTNYSPFKLVKDSDITKTVGTNVLTDEILSRFVTYSQGKTGSGSVYMGSDIENYYPILFEPKRNPTDAANIVILAETGGGKSFMVKNMVIQLLSRSDIVGTINDIEGDEYETLGYLVAAHEEVVILNMAEGSGSYFDPVEIYLTGDPNLDDEMYSISYNFTLSLLKTLVGLQSGKLTETINDSWAEQMIVDGVENFYNRIGVDSQDPSTWSRSKGYRIQDVYEEILKVDYDNEDFKKTRDLTLARLRPYFEGQGGRSALFKEENRISIESIRTAKLVINSFGLKGRSEANMDAIQINLMLLYAAEISYLRSIFAFNAGKYNFKLWEEFQRFSKLGGTDSQTRDILNTSLTGGRKLGEISVICSNKASEMLRGDEFGVFENYTTICIGAIADEKIRHELCDRISMPLIKKELDYISKFSKKKTSDGFEAELTDDEIEANPYAKAFFIYMDRDEYSIGKVRLPKHVRESPLFRTGVDSKER